MIKNTKKVLATPDYYLGNMQFCDLEGDLVYTNPFDFYYWKPNKHLIDLSNLSFAFERPQGRPLLSCIVGDKVEIFFYNCQDEVKQSIKNKLIKLSFFLNNLFEYRISEILFFIDGDLITFGMISNVPYASRNKEWFPIRVCEYFKKEIRGHGKS